MSNLFELVARLTDLGERWRGRTRYWRARALLSALALGAGVLTLGFLSAASYLFFAQAALRWQAAAVTALFMAILAASLAVASRALRGRLRARPASTFGETSRTAALAVDEALRSTNLRGTDLVIASLAAGIALGAGADRRRKPD